MFLFWYVKKRTQLKTKSLKIEIWWSSTILFKDRYDKSWMGCFNLDVVASSQMLKYMTLKGLWYKRYRCLCTHQTHLQGWRSPLISWWVDLLSGGVNVFKFITHHNIFFWHFTFHLSAGQVMWDFYQQWSVSNRYQFRKVKIAIALGLFMWPWKNFVYYWQYFHTHRF